jgi:succinate dehydrogenase / fumarate reductase cytochrome b subunit
VTAPVEPSASPAAAQPAATADPTAERSLMRYAGNYVSYRGREGSWAWLFHRISGVAIWLFVILHVIDIYLVGGDPKAYDGLLQIYASVPGRFMEALLGAALLYHALNGFRIIVIDLWPAMTVHHRKLWWISWAIFIIVGVPGALIILLPVWRGLIP